MILLFWLGLHAATLVVMRLILGRDPYHEHPNREALLTSLLWHAAPLSWLFDQRETSAGQSAVGFTIYVLGAALLTWARRVNPHFRPEIVTPPEVITSGPYAFVAHPGYLAMIAMGTGSCLMLGHVLGWFPLALYSFLLMLRAQEEERLLRQV